MPWRTESMDPQVIVEYGCEDGRVTVYGVESEDGCLFWCKVSPSDLGDNGLGSSRDDWTGPKTANLSELLGNEWLWYCPVSIHPDFVPWFRRAYEQQQA